MKRLDVFVLVGVSIGGMLGVALVILGAVLGVPNFSVRSGYAGTHFLDSFLYALGNDWIALTVVAALWFVYLAVPFGICAAVAGIISRKRRNLK